MTTKERIKAEIDTLGDENLDELYKIIKHFMQTKSMRQKSSFMSRLKHIEIDAPADFSVNLDQYTSGQKQIE
ncbi:MAG: hypothetical protein GY927_03680 [bacterium]|nr:hypothetical protein [bacterium]